MIKTVEKIFTKLPLLHISGSLEVRGLNNET